MTYHDYLRGDDLILSLAPTGYREPDEQTSYVPVTPEEIATAVYEGQLQGVSIAHVHGRSDDGTPEPRRLPAVARAIRAQTTDVLVEYGVGPDTELGDYLDVIDQGPRPDIAEVRVGPEQYGHRGVSTVNRRDVDRFLKELRDRDVKPNLLVTSGRDLNEVYRLVRSNVVESDPLLTLKIGARDGTVATPQVLLALLDAAPDQANVLVSASGPNQYPLTTIATFYGAHVRTGMEDNLYLDRETPVQDNAQLVQRVGELVFHSQRSFATFEVARDIISVGDQQRDISA
ncbi:3-keto-5-aminohexanoate cleavage protein [Halomicroarcula sp. GCM10025817]|uniref:3-keto-5-aminohexanoate cleavage protein n=1 Tax=Halomicroarcula sp. GCM10025817 TaxID=3252672 RepID=UPI0036238E18